MKNLFEGTDRMNGNQMKELPDQDPIFTISGTIYRKYST